MARSREQPVVKRSEDICGWTVGPKNWGNNIQVSPSSFLHKSEEKLLEVAILAGPLFKERHGKLLCLWGKGLGSPNYFGARSPPFKAPVAPLGEIARIDNLKEPNLNAFHTYKNYQGGTKGAYRGKGL